MARARPGALGASPGPGASGHRPSSLFRTLRRSARRVARTIQAARPGASPPSLQTRPASATAGPSTGMSLLRGCDGACSGTPRDPCFPSAPGSHMADEEPMCRLGRTRRSPPPSPRSRRFASSPVGQQSSHLSVVLAGLLEASGTGGRTPPHSTWGWRHLSRAAPAVGHYLSDALRLVGLQIDALGEKSNTLPAPGSTSAPATTTSPALRPAQLANASWQLAESAWRLAQQNAVASYGLAAQRLPGLWQTLATSTTGVTSRAPLPGLPALDALRESPLLRALLGFEAVVQLQELARQKSAGVPAALDGLARVSRDFLITQLGSSLAAGAQQLPHLAAIGLIERPVDAWTVADGLASAGAGLSAGVHNPSGPTAARLLAVHNQTGREVVARLRPVLSHPTDRSGDGAGPLHYFGLGCTSRSPYLAPLVLRDPDARELSIRLAPGTWRELSLQVEPSAGILSQGAGADLRALAAQVEFSFADETAPASEASTSHVVLLHPSLSAVRLEDDPTDGGIASRNVFGDYIGYYMNSMTLDALGTLLGPSGRGLSRVPGPVRRPSLLGLLSPGLGASTGGLRVRRLRDRLAMAAGRCRALPPPSSPPIRLVPGGYDLPAGVHPSSLLHPGEAEFLEIRKRAMVASFARFIGVDEAEVDPRDIPTVAFAASGGGYRAMVSSFGFVAELERQGLLDCVSYMAGLSGSSWMLARLYAHALHAGANGGRLAPGQVLEELPPRLEHHLINVLLPWTQCVEGSRPGASPARTRFATHLLRRTLETDSLSAIDIWGAALGTQLLDDYTPVEARDTGHGSLPEPLRLSQFTSLLESGRVPLPIFTAVQVASGGDQTVVADVDTGPPLSWFEWTPLEAGSRDLGGFVPLSRLSSDRVSSDVGGPASEMPLHRVMAIGGSAFCATFGQSWRELVASRIEHHRTALEPHLDGMTSPQPPGGAASVTGAGALRQWTDWLTDLASESSLPFRNASLFSPAPIYNFPVLQDGSPTTQDVWLADAGIGFNLPLPPLLRQERGVDVILSFDASSEVTRGEEGIPRADMVEAAQPSPEVSDHFFDHSTPDHVFALECIAPLGELDPLPRLDRSHLAGDVDGMGHAGQQPLPEEDRSHAMIRQFVERAVNRLPLAPRKRCDLTTRLNTALLEELGLRDSDQAGLGYRRLPKSLLRARAWSQHHRLSVAALRAPRWESPAGGPAFSLLLPPPGGAPALDAGPGGPHIIYSHLSKETVLGEATGAGSVFHPVDLAPVREEPPLCEDFLDTINLAYTRRETEALANAGAVAARESVAHARAVLRQLWNARRTERLAASPSANDLTMPLATQLHGGGGGRGGDGAVLL
ncbi:hypothetical protein H696_02258 [Fonticula alba]|uniref:PLA2c domain-containing protein n=1 Tax=Fonticula alba TaxID=691883 RepID=A0A058ZCZ7_FONAL|nr:hypothetical protein H696_02258 [Fonticula alba]KCV71312.1 hypothetical protein H696_02258 [Fonticula alba]|eukprot:XP_009494435.1 hypothetical protein H696_02258 [Fonticula alba]